jgi:hypothetical protein
VYVAVSSPECRQNHDIKRANRFFENVAQCRYLGARNQNLFQEEIKRLNSGNTCYHLSSRLLPKNLELKYKKYNFACGFVWV